MLKNTFFQVSGCWWFILFFRNWLDFFWIFYEIDSWALEKRNRSKLQRDVIFCNDAPLLYIIKNLDNHKISSQCAIQKNRIQEGLTSHFRYKNHISRSNKHRLLGFLIEFGILSFLGAVFLLGNSRFFEWLFAFSWVEKLERNLDERWMGLKSFNIYFSKKIKIFLNLIISPILVLITIILILIIIIIPITILIHPILVITLVMNLLI